jgi:hypothetical protein
VDAQEKKPAAGGSGQAEGSGRCIIAAIASEYKNCGVSVIPIRLDGVLIIPLQEVEVQR